MRDDFISGWIRENGDIKAPERFTHNIMTLVNLEQAHTSQKVRSPFGLPFRIGSIVIFALLLIISILSPQADSATWLQKFKDMLPETAKLGISIQAPDLSFLAGYDFLVYIIISATMLALLDAVFVRKVLLREKP